MKNIIKYLKQLFFGDSQPKSDKYSPRKEPELQKSKPVINADDESKRLEDACKNASSAEELYLLLYSLPRDIQPQFKEDVDRRWREVSFAEIMSRYDARKLWKDREYFPSEYLEQIETRCHELNTFEIYRSDTPIIDVLAGIIKTREQLEKLRTLKVVPDRHDSTTIDYSAGYEMFPKWISIKRVGHETEYSVDYKHHEYMLPSLGRAGYWVTKTCHVTQYGSGLTKSFLDFNPDNPSLKIDYYKVSFLSKDESTLVVSDFESGRCRDFWICISDSDLFDICERLESRITESESLDVHQ